MKKWRLLSLLTAAVLGLSLLTPALAASAPVKTASQRYVEAMGHGWNLGNSFDGFNTDKGAVSDETSWGNPVVTRELIKAVKANGFQSIRMPMTLVTRWIEQDGKVVINKEWLARYKEVIDWAVDEGLYVMVNIHHDSWNWLSAWDGNEDSVEYVRFVQLWEQLADCFKDEPEQVCFETINEPQFNDGSDEEKQAKLDKLNLAAYYTIRESGGKNDKRMIVMPTLNTNYEKCAPLLTLIQGLKDENIIATVHYYSEWVYSANLGITGFDEALNEEGNTPRKAADSAMSKVYDAFTKNGIGVVIGEYGLLGYDKSEKCNQLGEELKYYEYMNELSRKYGICLMFWDNGSGIDRRSGEYNWKKPLLGTMLKASVKGRSSYTEGLDTLYFDSKAEQGIAIPLTLNGNTFQGIQGLKQGDDYTYDEKTATVTLKTDYINKGYEEKDGYGAFAQLTFQFSSGADWHETLVKCALPVFGDATGTTNGLTIPTQFNGSEIRRITAYSGEERTGPNSSWWKYLEHSSAYQVRDESLTLTNSFFNECAEGQIRFVIELYDGKIMELWVTRDHDSVVTGKAEPVDLSVFTDIVPDAWYQDAVRFILANGAMNGTGEGTFTPGGSLTRAQMCQIVYNMAGTPQPFGKAEYNDVAQDAWYAAPVAWCIEEEIVSAEGGSFEPERLLTRQEVVEFLYRYAVSLGRDTVGGSLEGFSDADQISAGQKEAMSWAVGQGIVNGTPEGTLEPRRNVSRAEAAAMVMRFFKNI